MSNQSRAGGKELAELLHGVTHRVVGPLQGLMVDVVLTDSRQARPGAMFVALPGSTVDGHAFVGQARQRGCTVLVVEEQWWSRPLALGDAGQDGVTWVVVADCRKALAHLAAAFFGNPAQEMCLIGITGTNGKTTTSYLVEAMVRACGGKPGVIGTVEYRFGDSREPASLTTPEPVTLHGVLRRMADGGVTHVIMEASSHALSQERLHGLRFDVALFTNLSRDHLDFHGDMESYFQSKRRLFFKQLKGDGAAVVVIGGEQPPEINWGRRLYTELREKREARSTRTAPEGEVGEGETTGAGPREVFDCGEKEGVIVLGPARFSANGIVAAVRTPTGVWPLNSPLVGEFNARNLLGAIGVGVALGLDGELACQGLTGVARIPGRLERVPASSAAAIFVDFAHTPDALENVLRTLRKLAPTRLIVVFGCGGDRDSGKRPLMGQVAGRLADVVIVTSDNPRSEEPAAILRQIETGLATNALSRRRAEEMLGRTEGRGYDVIESRRQAIGLAVRHAGPGDIVLLGGKGHEEYQITRAGRRHFNDREEAQQQLCAISW